MDMNCYKALVKKMPFRICVTFLMALVVTGSSDMKAQSTDPSPYCQVNDDCGGFFLDAVTNVQIGSFSNSSGCNNSGSVTYWDNFGTVETVVPGGNIQISATVDPGFDFLRVWVDWNGDGTFQASESVLSGGGATISGNVQVPSNAKPGLTRFRVMANAGGVPPANSACTLPSFAGEVEDYQLEIVCPPGADLSLSSINPQPNQGPYGYEDFNVTLGNFRDSVLSQGDIVEIYYKSTLSKGVDTLDYELQSDLSCGGTQTVDLGNVNLACRGRHQIKVWTAESYDRNRSNDTISKTYINKGSGQIGKLYEEDFSNGAIPAGWQANDINDFAINTNCIAEGTGSLFIDGFENNFIETSTIDLSNVNNVILNFQYREAENCGGEDPDPGEGVRVEYWDGNTWNTLYSTDGANDVRSFEKERFLIDQGLTQNFKLRFYVYNASANSNDSWLFDDINIFEVPDVKRASKKPTTLGINVSDTVFDNAPVKLSPSFTTTVSDYQWIVNDKVQAVGKEVLQDTFVRSPNDTKDTVSLVSYGCFGMDTSTKIVDIKEPTQAPEADFVADKNVIDPNGKVAFTNVTRNGGIGFTWDVQPRTRPSGLGAVWGSTNYGSFRPVNVYEDTAQFLTPGLYDVILTASNSFGSNTTVKEDYIRVRDYQDICSGTETKDTIGTLYDGSFSSYPADANCSFIIRPCGNKVKLNLDKLDLKQNEAYLRIYDGTSPSGKPLWDQSEYGNSGITGDTSNPGYQQTLVANSGAVLVQFESGSNPRGDGFRLSWNNDTEGLPALQSTIVGDTAVCEGIEASFMAKSNGKDPTFEWYINESNPASTMPDTTGMNFMPTIKDGTNDDVRLVTKACGRRDVQTATLTPKTTTGTPQVDFTADKQVVDLGDTVRLAETTPGCVRDRTWNILPDDFEFVEGTSDSSANPVVVFDETGSYVVELSNTTNGNTSGSTRKTGFIRVIDYCDPSVQSLNSDIGISRFSLESIDNSSDIGNEGYTNYIPETPNATLEKGASLPITIERNTAINPVSYVVWIDFNSDGDFNDRGEQVYKIDEFEGTKVMDTLDVPANVPFGTYRLRVGANLQGIPNRGCGPNKTGEYEDYQIQIVPDQKAPEILLSGGDTVTLEACQSASDFIRGAFAKDLVDGRINNLTVNGNVDPQTPGFYTVSYEVTDQNGNTSTKDQVFEVLPDQMAPTFDLAGPSPFTLGVNQNFNDPGVTNVADNCSANPSVSIDDSDLNTGQLGRYTVDYTVTDADGNAETKSRIVKVVDTVAPQAELAGNDPLRHQIDEPFTDPGLQNISDNFWSTNDISISKNGAVDFGIAGTYQLTYRVEDGSGNTTLLSRTVIVEDLEAPQVTATFSQEPTKNDTLEVEVNDKANVRQTLTISDNSGAYEITEVTGDFFQRYPDGIPNQLGNYSVGYTVVDSNGNQTKVNFTVEVVDNTAPTITLKGQNVIEIPRFDTTAYEVVDSVSIDDNYYQDFQLTVETSGSYFDTYKESFPSGAFDIDYTVTDPSGNSASVTRSVITRDVTGIQNAKGIENLEAYPNPVQEELQIRLTGESIADGQLTLTNVLGQQVEEIANGRLNGSYRVNVTGFDAGIYFLRLSTEDQVRHQKIIVQ
jgi:PKD repeat protein